MPVIYTHWTPSVAQTMTMTTPSETDILFFIPLGGHVITFVVFIPRPESSLNHPLLYPLNSDSFKIRIFQDQLVYYKYSWLRGVPIEKALLNRAYTLPLPQANNCQ